MSSSYKVLEGLVLEESISYRQETFQLFKRTIGQETQTSRECGKAMTIAFPVKWDINLSSKD